MEGKDLDHSKASSLNEILCNSIYKKQHYQNCYKIWENDIPIKFLQGSLCQSHLISRLLPAQIPNALLWLFPSADSIFLQTRIKPYVRHLTIPGSTFSKSGD